MLNGSEDAGQQVTRVAHFAIHWGSAAERSSGAIHFYSEFAFGGIAAEAVIGFGERRNSWSREGETLKLF